MVGQDSRRRGLGGRRPGWLLRWWCVGEACAGLVLQWYKAIHRVYRQEQGRVDWSGGDCASRMMAASKWRQFTDGRARRAVACPIADKSKRRTVNPWGTRERGASAKPRTSGERTCSESQHTPGLTVRVLANAAIDSAPACTAQSLGVVDAVSQG
jgi:hypothetical protein